MCRAMSYALTAEKKSAVWVTHSQVTPFKGARGTGCGSQMLPIAMASLLSCDSHAAPLQGVQSRAV